MFIKKHKIIIKIDQFIRRLFIEKKKLNEI